MNKDNSAPMLVQPVPILQDMIDDVDRMLSARDKALRALEWQQDMLEDLKEHADTRAEQRKQDEVRALRVSSRARAEHSQTSAFALETDGPQGAFIQRLRDAGMTEDVLRSIICVLDMWEGAHPNPFWACMILGGLLAKSVSGRAAGS